jgi:hypothetical protein
VKLKQGYCLECNDGKLKDVISGKCKTHYWARVRKKSAEKIFSAYLVKSKMNFNYTYTTLTQQTLEQLLERQELVGVCPYVSMKNK